jgi:hypothetical protein
MQRLQSHEGNPLQPLETGRRLFLSKAVSQETCHCSDMEGPRVTGLRQIKCVMAVPFEEQMGLCAGGLPEGGQSVSYFDAKNSWCGGFHIRSFLLSIGWKIG